MTENSDDDASLASNLHVSLLAKAKALLAELDAFKTYINQHELDISISKFCKDVENETKAIEAVELTSNDFNKNNVGAHRLRSSNLVFYEAIWNIAKQNKHVTALQRRTRWVPSSKAASTRLGLRNHLSRTDMATLKLKENIVIDVVAEDGKKWIKVWTKSHERLLLDLAKEGFIRSDSSDEEELLDENNLNSLQLTRLANDLREASRNARVHHVHPKVHFVLPNIIEGQFFEIDAVLRAIRATGAILECGSDTLIKEPSEASQDLDGIFSNMASKNDIQANLTDTLNLDCTVIVALVSDISHIKPQDIVVPLHYEGSTFRTIDRQIKSETQNPVLEYDLYPIVRDRKLVCTRKVMEHVQKILQLMGTEEEVMRLDIVLGSGEFATYSSEELRLALQKVSAYAVPSDLLLPVEAVLFDIDNMMFPQTDSLRPRLQQAIADRLCQHPKLTYLNASAFMSGWAKRQTTITLNRTIAHWISRYVDELLDAHEQEELPSVGSISHFEGPEIHVCGRDRSLLGSEKSDGADRLIT